MGALCMGKGGVVCRKDSVLRARVEVHGRQGEGAWAASAVGSKCTVMLLL